MDSSRVFIPQRPLFKNALNDEDGRIGIACAWPPTPIRGLHGVEILPLDGPRMVSTALCRSHLV